MKSKRQRRRLHLECLEDRRLLASLQTAASFTLDSQAVADVDTKQVNALGEKARTYAASSYKQQYAKATSNGDAYSNTHTSGIRAELSTYLSNTDSKSPAVAVAAKASGTLSVQILPDERDAIGEQVWVKYQLDYDDIYFGIPYDPSEVPSLFAQATATSTAGIKFEHRTDNSVDYPGASELYTGVVRETVGSTVGISFEASIVGNSYTDRTHYKKIEPSVQISVISIPDDLKAFDLKANKLTLTGMNAHQQLEFNIEMEGDKVGSSKVDVAFYWANGSGADQRIGEPAGMMELDIKAWKAGVYKLAFPYDQLDKTHAASASHLQLVIDPYFEIGDRSLLNNFTDIEIYPLVVNVITHGWDSPVSLCDPTNTGDILEPFRAIADKLDAMPDQDSEYYGRVASYIPRWDSNDGFSSAIFSLAWAEVAEYLKLHYQDQFDFIAAGIAAYVSDLFEADARRASRRSALQGELAARRITQEIIDTYLLDSDASNKLQKIQLIGHSRGASVNARISQLLKAAGYDNVVYYVSLDGHGTDWPDGAGIIGDFNIDKTAQAVNKVNFRVESGLGECVVDLLRKKLHESQPGSVSDYAWSILIGALDDTSLVQYFKDLDLKAPYRFGGSVRDNPTIVGAQGTPSNHSTIPEDFLDQPQYFCNNYLGQFSSACPPQIRAASQTESPFMSDSRTTFVEPMDAENVLDFGTFDEAWDTIAKIDKQLAGAASVPELAALMLWLRERAATLQSQWDTSGSVQLVPYLPGNAAVLLSQTEDTAISQLVSANQNLREMSFDYLVLNAGTGDELELTIDGRVVQTISLAGVPRGALLQPRISLRHLKVNHGVVELRLNGPVSTKSRVFIDNVKITADPAPAVDLSVRVIADSSTVVAGGAEDAGTANFTLQVANKSNIEGHDVSVRFELPDENKAMRLDTSSLSGDVTWDADTGKGIWTVRNLPAGTTQSLSVPIVVASHAVDNSSVLLEAFIEGAAEKLANPKDDLDAGQIRIVREVDLALNAIPIGTTKLQPGGQVSVMFGLQNLGPSDASGIQLLIGQNLNGADGVTITSIKPGSNFPALKPGATIGGWQTFQWMTNELAAGDANWFIVTYAAASNATGFVEIAAALPQASEKLINANNDVSYSRLPVAPRRIVPTQQASASYASVRSRVIAPQKQVNGEHSPQPTPPHQVTLKSGRLKKEERVTDLVFEQFDLLDEIAKRLFTA